MTERRSEPRGARRLLLPLVASFASGAALRLWNLRDQILLGDELHAVRSALDWDLPKILTTYRLADNSIPLTAFYRLAAESSLGLSEWILRLPPVLAGLSILVLLPWTVDRELGRRSAVLAGWLVALSPSLVYYSRIARSYAVVVALGLAAFALFWRWWERDPRWRWALGYCACAAAAVWFHLGAAPFVAAPVGFAVLDLLGGAGRRSPDRGAKVRRLLGCGALLAALVASFVLPAWPSFVRLLKRRPGSDPPGIDGFFDTLSLQGGTAHPWLTILFWSVALAGLWLLIRARPRFAFYSLAAVAAQWLAVAVVLKPTGVSIPIVLNRYVLVALPVVLIWVAVALGRMTRVASAGRRRWPGWATAGALLVLLAALGPYAAEPGLRFGPFAGSNTALKFSEPVQAPPPEGVPAIYRLLGREPGSGAVLQAPSATAWWQVETYRETSRIHGRSVVLASDDRHLDDPRLTLRNLVPLDPERFLESRARFVVVDLDRRRTSLGAKGAGLAPALAQELAAEWGEPHLVDAGILVWDLDRLRREAGLP